MLEYRWLTDSEIEQSVNPALASRNMPQLNINPVMPTCRVAGAFADGVLIRAFCLQLHPVLGPLVEADSTIRDNGEATRGVVDFMSAFLDETKARGYLTICESEFSERLAKRHGMKRIEFPVYLSEVKP